MLTQNWFGDFYFVGFIFRLKSAKLMPKINVNVYTMAFRK